jgi:hypothetical protein
MRMSFSTSGGDHWSQACIGDVGKAVKGRARLAKLAAQVPQTGGSGTRGAPATPEQLRASIFEWAAENGTKVPTYTDPISKHDIATMNFQQPYIVSGNWLGQMLDSSDEKYAAIQMQTRTFEQQFTSWDKRGTEKRAGRPVKDDAVATFIGTKLLSLLGAPQKRVMSVPDDKMTAPIKLATSVQHFGLVGCADFLSTEQLGLATLRCAASGTRSCIIVKCAELAKYVKVVQKFDEGVHVGLDSLQQFLLTASRDTFAAMPNGGCTVWHCTLGPGDTFFVPPACYVYEVLNNRNDTLGFKKSFLLHDDGVKQDYEWFAQTGATNDAAAKLALETLAATST